MQNLDINIIKVAFSDWMNLDSKDEPFHSIINQYYPNVEVDVNRIKKNANTTDYFFTFFIDTVKIKFDTHGFYIFLKNCTIVYNFINDYFMVYSRYGLKFLKKSSVVIDHILEGNNGILSESDLALLMFTAEMEMNSNGKDWCS